MMSETADLQTRNKKSGLWFLWCLIAFFVVFASVDAFFVYKALSTHTGVVTENPYEKGLRYNEILEEARKQKENEQSAAQHSGG